MLIDYNPKTYLNKLNIDEGKRKELNDIIFHNQKLKDCLNGFITNSELIEYLIKENLKYKNEIEQMHIGDVKDVQKLDIAKAKCYVLKYNM